MSKDSSLYTVLYQGLIQIGAAPNCTFFQYPTKQKHVQGDNGPSNTLYRFFFVPFVIEGQFALAKSLANAMIVDSDAQSQKQSAFGDMPCRWAVIRSESYSQTPNLEPPLRQKKQVQSRHSCACINAYRRRNRRNAPIAPMPATNINPAAGTDTGATAKATYRD